MTGPSISGPPKLISTSGEIASLSRRPAEYNGRAYADEDEVVEAVQAPRSTLKAFLEDTQQVSEPSGSRRTTPATTPSRPGRAPPQITSQAPAAAASSSAAGTRLVDEDAEFFSAEVDAIGSRAKGEVMAAFLALKRRLVDSHASAMEASRKSYLATLSAKQDEAENLKEDVVALLELVDHKDAVVNNTVDALGALKAQDWRKEQLSKYFGRWRDRYLPTKDGRKVAAMATKLGRQAQLRHCFARWLRYTRAEHRITEGKMWERKNEKVRSDISLLYEEKLALLRAQLSEAQARAESEIAARMYMEENMKKAFMRGVCALNLEAMSLMRDKDGNVVGERAQLSGGGGDDGGGDQYQQQQQQQQQFYGFGNEENLDGHVVYGQPIGTVAPRAVRAARPGSVPASSSSLGGQRVPKPGHPVSRHNHRERPSDLEEIPRSGPHPHPLNRH